MNHLRVTHHALVACLIFFAFACTTATQKTFQPEAKGVKQKSPLPQQTPLPQPTPEIAPPAELATVFGCVTEYNTGKPVAGVPIMINYRVLAHTDSDGTYRIENAPVGDCGVAARDRGKKKYLVPHRQGAISAYYNYRQYQKIFLEPGAETRLDMQVIEGARIKGKVLDSMEQPVADTYIWIVNQPEDHSIVAAQTGPLGHFESCALVPNKPLEFLVWTSDRPGSARKVLSLKPGEVMDVNLVLNVDEDYWIEGAVMDTEGRRIPNASMRCWWEKGGERYKRSGISNAQGNYYFSGLEPSFEYTVYVYGQPLGYETAKQLLTLTEKDRVGHLDFRMQKPKREATVENDTNPKK